MADIQPTSENTWGWTQNDSRPILQNETQKFLNPYEKFILRQEKAEQIVSEFIEFGGPNFWIEKGMGHREGAEKEIFFVSDLTGQMFAISRSLHQENRKNYPLFEREREEKALREGNYYFPPCKAVESGNDRYIVRKFVTGRPATEEEIVVFEKKTRILVTGQGNAVIEPEVGFVILDLGDVIYNQDRVQ